MMNKSERGSVLSLAAGSGFLGYIGTSIIIVDPIIGHLFTWFSVISGLMAIVFAIDYSAKAIVAAILKTKI